MAAETKEKAAQSPAGMKAERGAAPPEHVIAPEVASPGGPVPVSALVGTKEQAEELRAKREEQLERERNHPRASEELSEEQIEGLSSAERRAVARQRGYTVRGTRVSPAQFQALQDADDFIGEKPRKKKS